MTPREILATEAAYPGLMDDINTVLWQRQLIEEQIKDASKN